jgi:hypothetical protein
MRRSSVLVLGLFFATSVPALAADAMTAEELSTLLANGKTIMLGGEGTGYSGELTLNADGTGSGSAKTDDGKSEFKLEGTWEIRDGKFCRTWADIDGGKEVCETWVKAGDDKVNVMNGDQQIGANHW